MGEKAKGMRQGARAKEKTSGKVKEGVSGTGLLLDGSGQCESDGCLGLRWETIFTSSSGGGGL